MGAPTVLLDIFFFQCPTTHAFFFEREKKCVFSGIEKKIPRLNAIFEELKEFFHSRVYRMLVGTSQIYASLEMPKSILLIFKHSKANYSRNFWTFRTCINFSSYRPCR